MVSFAISTHKVMMVTSFALTLFIAAGCKSSSGTSRGMDLSNLSAANQAKAKAFLAKFPVEPDRDEASKRVLVIVNINSPVSEEIGAYYINRRRVPRANIALIESTIDEQMPLADYTTKIETPVWKLIKANSNPIDFLVLTKGVPIRTAEQGNSVDSLLMAAPLQSIPHPTNIGPLVFANNPYYLKQDSFSRKKYGFCLSTRLDGYSVADALKLVDHSLTAKPANGLFLLDESEGKDTMDFGMLQNGMKEAAFLLKQKGLRVRLDPSPAFVGSPSPLAGYVSWGSNDNHFDAKVYHSLTFAAGAICETYVSTSGRTFSKTEGGQSLIVDLIAQGVTGIKGYVSEPFSVALCRSQVLLDRYTGGFNLAESFYMSSQCTKWKDVVIGDPLCNPYSSTPNDVAKELITH